MNVHYLILKVEIARIVVGKTYEESVKETIESLISIATMA
jgi:hypothetical protein